MIGRAVAQFLATVIGALVWPIGVWDQWHTRHPGDPWETDE